MLGRNMSDGRMLFLNLQTLTSCYLTLTIKPPTQHQTVSNLINCTKEVLDQ